VLVLTFTGLPFVVRTLQPVLEDLDAEVEEAAAHSARTAGRRFAASFFPSWSRRSSPGSPGAGAGAWRVRLGDFRGRQHAVPYGNRSGPDRRPPGRIRLRRGDGLAVVLLAFSFVLLAVINVLQRWSKSHGS